MRVAHSGMLKRRYGLQRFFGLLRALVMREFKGRYRRSVLGPAWAVIQPVFYMIVFAFIQGVLQIDSEGLPSVIFTYSALVPWTFFTSAVSGCATSVLGNAGIVKKISVTREVFPMAAVTIAFVDLAFASIPLVLLMLYFRIPVGVNLLWIPVLIALTAALALGLGMGVAALGTFKHDIAFGIPLLMQFWLLLTPIMYSANEIPENWRVLYSLNPMTGIIEGFRNAIARNTPPDMGLLAISAVVTIVLLAVTWPVFRYLSQYFADSM